jgi:hypothetical protein
LACETDPFIIQLPGETEADAHERSDAHRSDYRRYAHYIRESRDFELATVVYLARVASKTAPRHGNDMIRPSTEVRPVAPLKGKLPTRDQTLIDETDSGLCDDRGDGHGAWAEVGDLVVVFEGLPKSESRPRGRDSFSAKAIRTIEILDRFREIGKEIEE